MVNQFVHYFIIWNIKSKTKKQEIRIKKINYNNQFKIFLSLKNVKIIIKLVAFCSDLVFFNVFQFWFWFEWWGRRLDVGDH